MNVEVPEFSDDFVQEISEHYARLMIVAYSEGNYTRTKLVELLGDWKYFEGDAKGTFESIVYWGLEHGFIDETIHDEIYTAVYREGEDV